VFLQDLIACLPNHKYDFLSSGLTLLLRQLMLPEIFLLQRSHRLKSRTYTYAFAREFTVLMRKYCKRENGKFCP
jgi:hypothetical protein